MKCLFLSKLIKRSQILIFEVLLNIRPCEITLVLKKLFFIVRRIIKVNNLFFFVDPVSDLGFSLIKDSVYEPNLTKLISGLLREGDVFLDLGSNEGYFSILASKIVGNAGRVIAVEPQKSLKSIFEKNIKLNNIQNIEIIQNAVGQESGLKLFPKAFSINTGVASFVNLPRYQFFKKEYVQVITLDSLIDKLNLQTIKMLKIDIEGYEYFALISGSQALAKKKIKYIYVDIHIKHLKYLNIDPNQIDELLINFGYEKKKVNDLYIYDSNLSWHY